MTHARRKQVIHTMWLCVVNAFLGACLGVVAIYAWNLTPSMWQSVCLRVYWYPIVPFAVLLVEALLVKLCRAWVVGFVLTVSQYLSFQILWLVLGGSLSPHWEDWLWIVAVSTSGAGLGPAAAWLASKCVNHDEPQGAVCDTCGYSLRGLREARCPECGESFDPALLQEGRARDG